MPALLALIIQFVVPVLSTLFALLVPALVAIAQFAFVRLPKIPAYFRLLLILYSDSDPASQERKILNGGFLMLATILTFMSYSLIPWTGMPLIGATMGTIALVFAVVIALTLMDIIFEFNKEYFLKKTQGKDEYIRKDIEDMKQVLDKFTSWNKIREFIRQSSEKINTKGNQNGINFDSEFFRKYIGNSLEALELYIVPRAGEYKDQKSLQLVGINDESKWLKNLIEGGSSAILGTTSGVSASFLTSAIFVKASIWTSIQTFFGISSGVAVSATVYSLLTVALPVGLGCLACLGAYSFISEKNNEENATKMSKFLTDIMRASLPMAWIDGEFSEHEKIMIFRFMFQSGIKRDERNLLKQEMSERSDFDEIMKSDTQSDMLFDDAYRNLNCSQSDAERIKHRLILCTAWEIAVADHVIHPSEVELHNKMARTFGISDDHASEIRRVISLNHYGKLIWMKTVDNLVEQFTFREQYRLNPSMEI